MGRPLRPVDQGRHRHVPARAGAGGRHRSVRQAVRGAARHRARHLRALFHRLPVRGLGRQAGARGARRRHVRDLGRGVKASQKILTKVTGSLVLVGAGKMGTAMLEGWLTNGLKLTQLIVIEPQPGKSLKALARRGMRLNPKPGPKAKADASAIVIAVKPQTAPDAVPPLGLM